MQRACQGAACQAARPMEDQGLAQVLAQQQDSTMHASAAASQLPVAGKCSVGVKLTPSS